jgi:K+:H+ antiporter
VSGFSPAEAGLLMAAPPPMLGSHALLVLLLQLSLLLLVALVLGRLAGRVGLPAVVGELATGLLLGPSLFGHLAPSLSGWLIPSDANQFHLLDAVGQIGVLLLVGATGAELDLAFVRRNSRTAASVSALGLVVPLVAGVGLGLVLPASLIGSADRRLVAALIGVALCITALPVLAKTLTDMNLIRTPVGKMTLTASMIDDAIGWMLLSVVASVAVAGLHAGTVLRAIVSLVGFLLLVAIAGWPLLRRAGDYAARQREASVTVACVVVVLLLFAATTQALGLEATFGAFVCGVLLGRARAGDGGLFDPLRPVVLGVLAPLFFASVGLRMNLIAISDPTTLALGALVLAVAAVTKFGGVYVGARLSHTPHWEAVALGGGMNSRGVVQIVVATVGLSLGIFSPSLFTIIVLVAVVTSVTTPPIMRYALARAGATPTRPPEAAPTPMELVNEEI